MAPPDATLHTVANATRVSNFDTLYRHGRVSTRSKTLARAANKSTVTTILILLSCVHNLKSHS
eukprot:2873195-Prymnesium_polylepis.1